jgi:hypothetical protein
MELAAKMRSSAYKEQKMHCLRAFHKFELSADNNHTFSLQVHSLRALGMTRFEAVDHQQ